jgi:hypothetical protein
MPGPGRAGFSAIPISSVQVPEAIPLDRIGRDNSKKKVKI